MTDRMSNVEIEDVLSSIRRLVSDETRPQAAAARPAPARLILTPALRVDRAADLPAGAPEMELSLAHAPEEEEPAGAPAEPVSEAASDDAVAAGDDAPLAARLAELELLLDAQGQPFEADEETPPAVWPSTPVPEAPFLDADATEAAEAPAAALRWTEPAPDPAPALDGAPVAEPDHGLPLDEAVLRDLIRDVLREELQGRLGERVTRNLRKMVRSEVARALAARGIT